MEHIKVIIAPDKFKGSLTSMQACECIRSGVLQANKNAAIKIFPMADGGDGFATAIKYYWQTATVHCKAVNPLMKAIDATYEWDETNKTAIIELASASGLMLLKEDEQNPLHTSTYGTGLLIQHAIEKGACKIIVGLGGSATNDAGIGILSALGFGFKNKQGNILPPVGASLSSVNSIEPPPLLPSVEFVVACDVANTLFGRQGAAYIYAPQKGADGNAVKILDKGLRHFAYIIQLQTGKDIASFSGSGAAGGTAAGLAAFFKTQIVSGAKFIIDISKIEEQIEGAGIVITGEGKLDSQSLQGKAVYEIAMLAKKRQTPLIIFCGQNTLGKAAMQKAGKPIVVALTQKGSDDAAIKNAAALLSNAAANYFKQAWF